MSVTTELQTQMNFLACWMPSTSRAGVILNPPFDPVNANAYQTGWLLEGQNDSFITQFSPLPVSSNSSCISVDSFMDKNISSACGEAELSGTGFHNALDALKLPSLDGNPLSLWDDADVFNQDVADYPVKDAADANGQCSSSFIQKLEKLKEWQLQKQGQLKMQQTYQLQKVTEEQKKLVESISAQEVPLDFRNNSEVWHLTGGSGNLSYQEISGTLSITKIGIYEQVAEIHHSIQKNVSENFHYLTGSVMMCVDKIHLPDEKLAPCPELEEKYFQSTLDSSNGSLNTEHTEEQLNDCHGYGESQARPDFLDGGSQICQQEKDFVCNEDLLESQDRPIKPGIGMKMQSFEEMLEEQLKLEEERLKCTEPVKMSAKAEVKGNIKRPFLKRGEGLARFTRRSFPVKPPCKEMQPSNTEKVAQAKSVSKINKPQVQRKTSVLKKKNLSGKDIGLQKKADTHTLCKMNHIQETNSFGHQSGENTAEVPPKLLTETKIQVKPVEKTLVKPFPVKTNWSSEEVSKVSDSISAKMHSSTSLNPMTYERNKQYSISRTARNVPPSGQEYSFDLSFQKKIEKWDEEKEKENLELNEFEMLEQAADEISFSSNSSFMQKVLHLDVQGQTGHRLSSTPIKTLKQHQQTAKISPFTRDGKVQTLSQIIQETLDSKRTPVASNKAVILNCISKKSASITNDQEGANRCSESCQDISDSEVEEDDTALQPCINQGVLRSEITPCQHINLYDKTAYQDHTKESEDESDGVDEVGYTSDESTVIEKKCKLQPGNIDPLTFDDDDTWNDLEVFDKHAGNDEVVDSLHIYCTAIDRTVANKEMKRKVANGKTGDRKSGDTFLDNRIEQQPASELMVKLFPSLKPKNKPAVVQNTVTSTESQQSPENKAQSDLLNKRCLELEAEIEKFRTLNSALENQRQESNKASEEWRKKVADFEKVKADELTRLEEYKKEEMRKLQKERKVFEKYAAAARAIPDKKEREEMQVLKQQVTELQEELKRKETRWSNTFSRLKKQLESLTKENGDLRNELKVMERLRVEAWKKMEADNEKHKQVDSVVSCNQKLKPMSPPGLVKFSATTSASVAAERPKESCSPIKEHEARKNMPVLADKCQVEALETAGQLHNVVYPGMATKPHQTTSSGGLRQEVLQEINHADGKIEQILQNGDQVIIFPNGSRKEVCADGKTVKVTFFNGDIKQIMADQRVIYFYADAQTTHTTYPDGLEVLQFPNNQIEKHFPDGRKEITFPDQTIKNVYPDGQEESLLPDGTIIRVAQNGNKIIEFINGQRELHTSEYKRREYPDGTVKTVYASGQQETHYPTGRVRIKDKDGNIIVDTQM
ncbi:centromere protein J isoform X1 [Erpetoichthys calabaricus]|uniref:centromere protein J isoform X1 n=1 Tax=Erpetoichthys calabaricus TaxID=27687 RepID=UPI0022344191|nr:centromere protein J isoform X1 [Erpetoichthys calabaricus]